MTKKSGDVAGEKTGGSGARKGTATDSAINENRGGTRTETGGLTKKNESTTTTGSRGPRKK